MVNLNVIYLSTCIYLYNIYVYEKIVAPRGEKKKKLCVIIAKLHIVFICCDLALAPNEKEELVSTMSMHRRSLIFRWLLLVVAVDNVYLDLIVAGLNGHFFSLHSLRMLCGAVVHLCFFHLNSSIRYFLLHALMCVAH